MHEYAHIILSVNKRACSDDDDDDDDQRKAGGEFGGRGAAGSGSLSKLAFLYYLLSVVSCTASLPLFDRVAKLQPQNRPDKSAHQIRCNIMLSTWSELCYIFCGRLILFSLHRFSLLCFSHGNFISQLFREQLHESVEVFFFFFSPPFPALCAGTSLKPESEPSLT